MKLILSERNLVLVLFVMVFVIFSFAHEDSKKLEKGYMGMNSYSARNLAALQKETRHDLKSSD
jgi:hypothetical protein